MSDTEKKQENVVSLADKREEKSNTEVVQEKTDYDFEAIMKANAEKAQKLKQERSKSNTSVKRSYRLTPKK